MSIMESVKEHPYIAAGGVFAAGIVLILILAGGSGSAPAAVTSTDSNAALGTQYAMAQLQSQVQAQGIAASLAGRQNDNQTALSIAQLTAGYQANHDQIAASTSIALAGLQSQMEESLANTAAGVQIHNTDAQLTALTNTNQTQVNLASLQAGVINYQTQALVQMNNNATAAAEQANEAASNVSITAINAGITQNYLQSNLMTNVLQVMSGNHPVIG